MCLPSNMSHKADCVNSFGLPDIYCLVCIPSNSVEYFSPSFDSAQSFYKSLPEEVRDFFCVAMYRAI